MGTIEWTNIITGLREGEGQGDNSHPVTFQHQRITVGFLLIFLVYRLACLFSRLLSINYLCLLSSFPSILMSVNQMYEKRLTEERTNIIGYRLTETWRDIQSNNSTNNYSSRFIQLGGARRVNEPVSPKHSSGKLYSHFRVALTRHMCAYHLHEFFMSTKDIQRYTVEE